MGLIGTAIAGALSAGTELGRQANDYFTKSRLQEEAYKAQALRDRVLSELRRGDYRAEAQTKLDFAPKMYQAETDAQAERLAALRPGELETMRQKAELDLGFSNRKPRTLAAGASEVVDGKITVTAPQKDLPPEQAAYYLASANRLNAEARAITDGLKYKGAAPGKPVAPSIKVEKDLDGTLYNLDQNSGAIGVIVPGEPAKKGTTRWFGPNDPDQPAGQPTIVWSLNGKPLKGGLSELYPAMKERVGDAGSTPGKTGWDSGTGQVFKSGKVIGMANSEAEARKLVAGYPVVGAGVEGYKFNGGDPNDRKNRAIEAPARPAPIPNQTVLKSGGASAPDIVGGAAVDAARARYSAARAKLMSFGSVGAKWDPAGYAAAQKEVDEAKLAADTALAEYQLAVGFGAEARDAVSLRRK